MNYYGVVYKVTCKTTNKKYIGYATNFQERKERHKWLSLERDSKTYFHNSIRKYGWEDFEWEIIDICSSLESMKQSEIMWISIYDSNHTGLNILPGGDGFGKGKDHPCFGRRFVRTKETRERIRLATLGNKNSLGRKHTKEELRKMSQSHIGRIYKKWTKEQKEKFSISRKKFHEDRRKNEYQR